MKTAAEVLAFLEKHRGQNISGQKLADALHISRAAVWKAIESLRADGYLINAMTRRGYCMPEQPDALNTAEIAALLGEDGCADRLHLFQLIDSTSYVAKRMAAQDAPSGTAVLAEEQTCGRGRMGRSFSSPRGAGLYLSLVLRPKHMTAADSVSVTTAACVAVCRAIESSTGLPVEIKWINDIYRGGKKICGILTEAVTDFESGEISCIVLGIGINFHGDESVFPPELRDKADFLFHGEDTGGVTRNCLAAEVIREAGHIEQWARTGVYLDEYRKRCFVLGHPVQISYPGGMQYQAKALDVDGKGGLILELPGGEKKVLDHGEVSVRVAE